MNSKQFSSDPGARCFRMLLMLARLRRFMEFDQLLSRMDKEGVARSSVTYCNIMTKCKENRDAGWILYVFVSFWIRK